MVAAPGVPGCCMAALGLLQSMLGFDETPEVDDHFMLLDGFGTATNVTGDRAIAVIVDRINSGNRYLCEYRIFASELFLYHCGGKSK